MNNLGKRIEFLANLSITIVSILLIIILVRSYLLTDSRDANHYPSPTISDNQLQKGTRVSLPDVGWQKNGDTLLLAISTTCHFCTESAPFYQRIVRERGNVRLVALAPQSAEEAQSYLKNLGVEVDEIKQVSPDTIGVRGTPTLILVDGEGNIKNFWVGLLTSDHENEVLTQLNPERASK
jgi:hypothetical protein